MNHWCCQYEWLLGFFPSFKGEHLSCHLLCASQYRKLLFGSVFPPENCIFWIHSSNIAKVNFKSEVIILHKKPQVENISLSFIALWMPSEGLCLFKLSLMMDWKMFLFLVVLGSAFEKKKWVPWNVLPGDVYACLKNIKQKWNQEQQYTTLNQIRAKFHPWLHWRPLFPGTGCRSTREPEVHSWNTGYWLGPYLVLIVSEYHPSR